MDNDEAGIKAIKKAEDKGILKSKDYNVAIIRGMKESELEDIFKVDAYKDEILEKYGVDLINPKFRTNEMKWSDRVKKIFELHGKIWSDALEMKIKYTVANILAQIGPSAIHSQKKSSIDALIKSIERKLDER